MLKLESMPPAPIRGEKGDSEGRLCGDSVTLMELAGVFAVEPESIRNEVVGEAATLGDARLPEGVVFGPLEASVAVGTGDTHLIGELEGVGESQGIGEAADKGEASVEGVEGGSSSDGREGKEAGDEPAREEPAGVLGS